VHPTPASSQPTAHATGSRANTPEFERSLAVVERHRAFLPVSADLSSRMPPVGDQGSLGSCTDWAMAYAARSYYSNTAEGRDVTKKDNLPSPNYVFHVSRTGSCDDGTSVDDALRVMRKGVLSLADYPYSDKCVGPPPAKVIARASDFRVRAVRKVDTSHADDAKGLLARGNPVLIRFNISSKFQDHSGDKTFSEPAPPRGDKNAGWHLMALVGYDERRQAFRLINSWGTDWGDHGYAWISYSLLRTRISDAYVLEPGPMRPKPLPPPPPPPVVKVVPPPPPPPPPKPLPPVHVVQPPRPAPVPVIQPPQPVPVVQPEPQPAPVVQPPPVTPGLSDLTSLSCAAVKVQAQGGQTVLSGYVGSDDDLNRVKLIAANMPNTALGNVIVAPWPQCEALQTLDRPLAIIDRPTIDIGSNALLYSGDLLKIQVRSPGQISYLYVSYIQADGSVVHLVQPNALVPQPTLPNQTLTFGSGDDGKPKFRVSPPYGREMIIAIASRSPLFDHELPQRQTERDYLTELRRALIYKPDPAMPDRELAATMTTLQTSAR
jgi:hypothetical protein